MNEEIFTETSTEVIILPETDTELFDSETDTEVSTLESELSTEFETIEASTADPVVYSFENTSGDVFYPIIVIMLITIFGFMIISRFER